MAAARAKIVYDDDPQPTDPNGSYAFVEGPRPRRKPQDRLPKQTPQEREATGPGMVEIDWRGHHLVIDSDPNHMSGKTLLAFEQDKILTAISGLLGTGWSQVENHTIEELGELFELVNKALGFEPGESEPSPA